MKHIKYFNDNKLNENLWSDPTFVTGIISGAAIFLGLGVAFVKDLNDRTKERLVSLLSDKAKAKGVSEEELIKSLSKSELLQIKSQAKSESTGDILGQAKSSLRKKGGSLI